MAVENIVDFTVRNPQDWARLIKAVFPAGIPTRACWEAPDAMREVLAMLGATRDVHIGLLASGGTNPLSAVAEGRSQGLTELEIGSQTWICDLRSVSFESFNVQSSQWSYFRIELGPQQPVGEIGSGRESFLEFLTEIRPGEYLPSYAWDERFDEESELPDTARLVVRALKGSIVIFAKTAPYTNIPHADSGAHEPLNSDEFRLRVSELLNTINRFGSSASRQMLDDILLGKRKYEPY